MRPIVPLVIVMLALSACATSAPTEEGLVIVTSIHPLAEFATAVAGEAATVTPLLPAGAEPHTWQPSANDIILMENADLVLLVGAEFEPWAEDMLESLSSQPKVLYLADDAVLIENEDEHHDEHGDEHEEEHHEEEHGHEDEMHADEEHHDEHEDEHADEHHEEGHEGHDHAIDPHVWLDFSTDVKFVARLAETLATFDAEGASTFEANAAAYSEKLVTLDNEYSTRLEGCSEELVVNHAAFGYLARNYGLEQHAIHGLSPEDEPTAQELAEISELVTDHGVTVIYAEELVSPKVAETLSRETGASVKMLNPTPVLTQEQIDKGVTFIDAMYGNLEALEAGLCT